MPQSLARYRALIARLFETHSQQEREKRAACLLALLLVFAIAILKYVTGVTVHHAPFTLYGLAVAISAVRGGMAPAVVATLASVLVGGFGAQPAPGLEARLLFTAEGLLAGFVVSRVRSRLLERAAQLGAAEAAVAELRLRDRHGRILDAALRHLEDTAGEAAVVVLDADGAIAEWRSSAARLYGYSPDQVVGESARVLFLDAPSPGDLAALLRRSLDAGSLRRPDVHQRLDGSRVDVELEIRPLRNGDASRIHAHRSRPRSTPCLG